MRNNAADSMNVDLTEDFWEVKHTAEFRVQKTSARVSNFAGIYFDIAQDAFAEYLIALDDPDVKGNRLAKSDSHDRAVRRLDRSAIKTIVFAAMTCEAAIYDLAAIHLSDDYASKVLNRLDPVSKWLVTPRLICGKSLHEDGPAINALRSLVGARNDLVHSKSLSGLGLQKPEQFKKIVATATKQSHKIASSVIPAYQAIVLLSLELERLWGTESASLPYISNSEYSSESGEVPQDVRKVILRCRQIDANFRTQSSVRSSETETST